MKRSASDYAYLMIRSSILNQKYSMGSQLKEVTISKELGITRTPIREAIIRLEREGMVETFHNRGAFVVRLSKREIKELYEIREALETKAISLGYRKASRDEITHIRDGLLKREKLVRGNLPQDYFGKVLDFHFEIIKLSNNEKMISIWKSLDSQLSLVRSSSTMIGKRYIEALKEHKEILSSLAKGNCRKTEQLMKAHIAKSRDNLLAHCLEVKKDTDSHGN